MWSREKLKEIERGARKNPLARGKIKKGQGAQKNEKGATKKVKQEQEAKIERSREQEVDL